MPRHVDHEQRRKDIIRAAAKLLVERGVRGVTFGAVAKELGGSTTVVTHYYPTIGELLDDLAGRTIDAWSAEVDQIMALHPDDPRTQLQAVLFEWLTPIEGDVLAQEQVRFTLLGSRSLGDETQRLLDSWEAGMRDLFRRCVHPLVADDEVDAISDVLRVAFNGIALSAAEHPDYWTAERQQAVLDRVVTALGLPGLDESS